MKALINYTPFGLLFFSMSCTTLSFIPQEGKAARFNLATVEYVQLTAEKQQEQLVEQIKTNLDEILNSLLEKDRNTIKNLEILLNKHEKNITTIAASIDSSNTRLGMLSAKLVKDLSDVKSSTRNMQMYIDQINSNLDTLPVEALKELNAALEEYMNKKLQDN